MKNVFKKIFFCSLFFMMAFSAYARKYTPRHGGIGVVKNEFAKDKEHTCFVEIDLVHGLSWACYSLHGASIGYGRKTLNREFDETYSHFDDAYSGLPNCSRASRKRSIIKGMFKIVKMRLMGTVTSSVKIVETPLLLGINSVGLVAGLGWMAGDILLSKESDKAEDFTILMAKNDGKIVLYGLIEPLQALIPEIASVINYTRYGDDEYGFDVY